MREAPPEPSTADAPLAGAVDQTALEQANGQPTGPDAVVVARALVKNYDRSGDHVMALAGVDLEVPRGQFYAIMGASGSGKSTLLYLVGGLTAPSDGAILVENQDLARLSDAERTRFRRRRLGIVFQDYNLLPTLTARENVALPLLLEGKRLDAAARTRVDELLEAVHLKQRAGHRPDALSGGEQQRVAIARALLNDPAILLADEPTGNLDSRQSAEIWTLLRRFASEQGKTILMVTHEAQGAAYADRVIVLKDGRIVGAIAPHGESASPGGSPDAQVAAHIARRYQELAG